MENQSVSRKGPFRKAMSELKASPDCLDALRREHHADCAVCAPSNRLGLRLRCRLHEDGSVKASFRANRFMQGYDGWLHGGVIAALLDGAMTNCLFAHGCRAPTAELRVRYRQPVLLANPLQVIARIVNAAPPLYVVSAEIQQDGEVRARATGKFVGNENGRARKANPSFAGPAR